MQVTLRIQPHDGGPEREVQLIRQRLTFNPVSSQVCKKVPWGARALPGGESAPDEGESTLGYIRVATFSKQTTENIKAALQLMQSEGADR